MSVAFRREGDEEHLEPKFELPIPAGPNLVTPRGRSLIDAQVKALEMQLAELTRQDRGETSIKACQRDLRYWQTRQITAEIAPDPTGETVEIGTTVRFAHNRAERELTIVGHDEADPAAGMIAFSAPLARALFGAEPGELIDFGGQEAAIELLSILVRNQGGV